MTAPQRIITSPRLHPSDPPGISNSAALDAGLLLQLVHQRSTGSISIFGCAVPAAHSLNLRPEHLRVQKG